MNQESASKCQRLFLRKSVYGTLEDVICPHFLISLLGLEFFTLLDYYSDYYLNGNAFPIQACAFKFQYS